jgi:hypothetical protein
MSSMKPAMPPGTSPETRVRKEKLTPLAIARADNAAGRFSTLRAEQDSIDKRLSALSGTKAYWYVGHHIDVPLYRDRPDGPQALKFETVAGPFTTRGAAEKVIERARNRADKD